MKKFTQEDDKIKILKYKSTIKEKHLYLCLLIIVNKVNKNILKLSSIVSLNPSVFEINIKDEFNKVEKNIYRFKLEDGFLSEISKNIYLNLYKMEEEIVNIIENEQIDVLLNILKKIFNLEENSKIKFDYDIEKYKYATYEKLKETNLNLTKFDNTITFSNNNFFIKTKPVINKDKGISIEKLKPKTEILCRLADDREVVKYIMKIFFSENKKEFYVKVTDILQKNKEYYEIICNITPVIFTKFILRNNQKVIIRK
ncbi:MAG: hypothetical protein ACK4WJ_01040 [Endomicrobiia bacterium]